MPNASTHDRIVEKADTLFYEQGFDTTSFADIAMIVGISRGNFYYHFRTKDEILDAVIARRMASTKLMLDEWSAETADPAARINCFINILITNGTKIMAYGCPVGTLSMELNKLGHHAHSRASAIFTLFTDWLSKQFAALGQAEADVLAMHVLARTQGVAALASAFHDEAFIRREVDELCDWVKAIAPQTNLS